MVLRRGPLQPQYNLYLQEIAELGWGAFLHWLETTPTSLRMRGWRGRGRRKVARLLRFLLGVTTVSTRYGTGCSSVGFGGRLFTPVASQISAIGKAPASSFEVDLDP